MNKISKVFQGLRRRGIVAKQNYECCQSCGGAAITQEIENRIKAGKLVKEEVVGCCFYHAQDAASLRTRKTFHLAYGPVESSLYGEIGKHNADVGRIICEELARWGVKYDWDGNGMRRIEVNSADAKAPAGEPLDQN